MAVHPEDDRYTALVGKSVILPLLNRKIPIIADTYVDRAFGTGVVKITPAHDFNDFQVGNRHKLQRINILNPDGTLNENAGPYQGMDRFEARKKINADLEAQGLLLKVEPHEHNVGHCYRCGTVVEPYYSKQWFVRMKPLAETALKAVAEGRPSSCPTMWRSRIRALAFRHPGLVHQPPDLVGAPHPRFHLRPGTRLRFRPKPHGLSPVRGQETGPGPGCPGHLVFLRPVAFFHPGLAGKNQGPGRLLPYVPDGDQLGHPFLLGGPHDDDGPEVHGPGSL